ncbi:MAG: heavy metal-binding domain-containing protein, partial [Candidatus Eremiobacteraeota bacterium]|nr:heavy metal-binding domain-containing protein [Candidatus Eremiobacteraeota bacterium]
MTIASIEGFHMVRSLGYVSATTVLPKNMLRATFRSIGSFIGLAAGEYLTDAERARESALDELRSRADALGANAILDLQFNATEERDG